MVLIFFRLVPSFNLSLCLAVSLPLFIFPLPSASSSGLAASQSCPGLFPSSLHPHSFSPSRLHPLPAAQSRRVPPALAPPLLFPSLVLCWPHCLSISPSALLQPVSLVLCLCSDLHSPSLPHAIFLHLEIVPILPLFHFSPFGQSLRDSFFILSFIFFRPLNLAPPPSPSPRGYTSVLQMFCPSQI